MKTVILLKERGNTMRKIFFIIALLCAVTIQAQNYTNIFTQNDTSATVRDSINFGFDAAQITIYNDATTNDTMFVSTDSLFAADKTFRRIGGTNLQYYINSSIIYLKFGSTATSGKKYRVEALR